MWVLLLAVAYVPHGNAQGSREYIRAGGRVVAVENSATPQVSDPSFQPAAGTYASAQSISITTATSGATVHYTTDGTAPNCGSPGTPMPVPVTTSLTIRAIGCKSGMTASGVVSAAYTIQTSGGGWYNPSWGYRKTITVEASLIPGGGYLVDFPLLVARTDSDLKSTEMGERLGKPTAQIFSSPT